MKAINQVTKKGTFIHAIHTVNGKYNVKVSGSNASYTLYEGCLKEKSEYKKDTKKKFSAMFYKKWQHSDIDGLIEIFGKHLDSPPNTKKVSSIPSQKPKNERISGEVLYFHEGYKPAKPTKVEYQPCGYVNDIMVNHGAFCIKGENNGNLPTLTKLDLFNDLHTTRIVGVLNGGYSENCTPCAIVSFNDTIYYYDANLIDVIVSKFNHSLSFKVKKISDKQAFLYILNGDEIIGMVSNCKYERGGKDVMNSLPNFIGWKIENAMSSPVEPIETPKAKKPASKKATKLDPKTIEKPVELPIEKPENYRSWVMKRAWSIRKAAALKHGCKVSEISMSESMKLAWSEYREIGLKKAA